MTPEVGDLVACYITNTNEFESLMQWGIVLDINETLQDILILDNDGSTRWWPERRWRVIQQAKSNKKE